MLISLSKVSKKRLGLFKIFECAFKQNQILLHSLESYLFYFILFNLTILFYINETHVTLMVVKIEEI